MAIKFNQLVSLLMLFACGSALSMVETIEYNSSQYLSQQYEMIKITFDDLNVNQSDDMKTVIITIPTNYGFTTGGYSIKPQMQLTIKNLSRFLRTYPESTLSVVGHTDSVGTEKSNYELGMKRAQTVANELLKNDISPFRISTESKGEIWPMCSNSTPAGRECNRRVEVVIALEKNWDF